MYINKVVSYKQSWDTVRNKYSDELSEIQSALDDLILHVFNSEKNKETGLMADRTSPRSMWDKILYDREWELFDRTHYSSDGTRINISRLGPVKKDLAASLSFGTFDNLTRWLFQQSAIAVKNGVIKIPILIVPVKSYAAAIESNWFRRENFEGNLNQLELLTPLSHQYPFLILGYSDEPSEGGPEIHELETDSYVDSNSVVDRSIVFPPEYHQAGLGILNFFGTYLREQYPEESASVTIEQDGLNVRMVIETESGESEIVEKALHEYELIISGNELPEKFTQNDKLVLELKSELRIASTRVEMQKDMIGMQNVRIEKLLDLVETGLSQKNTVVIDYSPSTQILNNVSANQVISGALADLDDLMGDIPRSNLTYDALNELQGSLQALENNNDPESVKSSPAISKFRRVIDKVMESGSDLNSALKKVESGTENFSKLAGKYNKIAEWCGLPVVPSVFTK